MNTVTRAVMALAWAAVAALYVAVIILFLPLLAVQKVIGGEGNETQ